MIRLALISAALTAAMPSFADTLTTVRAIRPMSIVAESDLIAMSADVPGALTDKRDVAGLEARVTLYPGRPIRPGDVGPPAVVERNAFVPLVYRNGTLLIVAEGRSLGRAAVGEWVRVMNIASRNTVTGRVGHDGRVFVTPN